VCDRFATHFLTAAMLPPLPAAEIARKLPEMTENNGSKQLVRIRWHNFPGVPNGGLKNRDCVTAGHYVIGGGLPVPLL
jgi:hypothetical protein